jgi:anti-anti-sigma factor
MPLARLEVQPHGNAVLAIVEGDIDLSNAADLRHALQDASDPATAGLIADLSRVGYLDSSGVAVLIALARDLASRRQRLAVVAPPESSARRVLEVVRFDRIAGLHTSLDEASAELGEPV